VVDDRERQLCVLLRARQALWERDAGRKTLPHLIVQTRMPYCARSLAAGSVRPTMPPFDEEYAAWPTCPSYAAIEAVLMTTPRCPCSSGSVSAMCSEASARTLNDPTRLMRTTVA
jgi:hypothetical protein